MGDQREEAVNDIYPDLIPVHVEMTRRFSAAEVVLHLHPEWAVEASVLPAWVEAVCLCPAWAVVLVWVEEDKLNQVDSVEVVKVITAAPVVVQKAYPAVLVET